MSAVVCFGRANGGLAADHVVDAPRGGANKAKLEAYNTDDRGCYEYRQY